MDDRYPTENETGSGMTAGQWFVLALLVLLNGAVLVLLVLALTGRLTL
jgi:hypothetical protein